MAVQKSSHVVTLALMGTAFAGAWWYNRDTQPLQRNLYASQDECECDYGAGRCSSDGGWYGPWYLSDPAQRARDARDPGPGGNCGVHYGVHGTGGGGGFWRSGSSGNSGAYYRGPIGVEDGYRHGFGGTARIGRAGG